MFMPMAREDQQINYLVSECLKKESVEKYLSEYLPQFPLLWLDPILMQKYVSLQLVEVTDDRTRRLLSFSKRACMYSLPNELENTIIKENYQLFDVLRGNDSILHPLGYTTEEETKIKEIDIEALRYGNKPVIEKLLLLEGNRNFVPESMAGMDFLRDPVSVCSLLFPIQIHDGHGELVFELYNYSTRIKNKLDSLKKYYLNALLLLDEKDEYWELIKDNWLKMDLDNEMLKKSRDIADAKGETEVAELLHLYSQIQPLNDLEKALITGNIFKLRTIATDADSLLASGYTSDDIKLIQESVRQKIDFRAEDYLSIANRLYLYQKNKNRTAELYYKLALHENNNMAVPGLFAIYARENRYEELCKLFEAHIDDSSLSNTTNNNTAYLNALYQTKQYQKFYAFWIAKKDSSAIDQIILLTVLLEIKAPSKAVEENVFNSQFSVTEDNRSFAKECLIRFADQTQSQTQGSLIKLYNLSFPVFTTQDLSDIRLAYKQATFDGFTEPEGIGIASLTTDITTDKIREWVEYLFGFSGDDQNKINIIRNVDWLYKKETEEYAALRAQIQKPENYVAFIFCGSDKLLTSCLEQRRESQMFQTLQYIEVGHMNYNDIQEIFRLQSARSDIIFSQDAISTIWQYTNGLVWYAKLLGYLVINNILANDLAIRNEVNRSDIVTAVQMLINGELGTDKYDLILKSMSTSRAAIVHAMAGLMPDMNKELSVDEISAALELLRIEGYTNPINGETVPFMNEKDLKGQLDLLEKMQYIDSNPSKTRFMFTADLYRLFFRDDKKLHLFEERSL